MQAVSNALLVVSITFLAIALASAANSVLKHGLTGLHALGKGTWAAFGMYVLSFVGFIATQGL
ncbi:hypothetical protein B5F40_06130 [Gordonibacter sp. An230]|uniref:hypothetical protein n=1 Tax=Gordonibacter sp. An230 TaxID=1965592 RepID=UPI000B3675C5|nr:hypothetical protein [Gordonibacter sp. An230]OUO90763.1 hypothetical protein B5F40_06130 [Gordonibacter sp. An230]